MKNIGRRLPLELQCSLYKGEQGDVISLCAAAIRGEHNVTPVERNVSVYQGYPVRRRNLNCNNIFVWD